ncbi:MAG TPA: PAAR domain-containing protein [Verrucomicrobiae bacterium]|nr:PAAR domain-containing protein [Verrucomicrobiae bacterium]
MPLAARVGDPTSHPGTISGPGVPTVLIGGLPAAVQGTLHTCAMPPDAGPHPPTPIAMGSSTVFIGGQAAARVGDSTGCGASIVSGETTVIVGG